MTTLKSIHFLFQDPKLAKYPVAINRYGQFVSSLRPNVFELHAVRGGVEVEAGVAGDEHVAGRQHLRALAPHNDVVTCENNLVET